MSRINKLKTQRKKYIDNKLISEQTHPEFPWLKIYNYTQKCQIDGVWDEITTVCRGLIIDTRQNKIVANPFPKFFNFEENKTPEQHGLPQVFDKLDGSLGILYWVEDIPYIATRGSFESDQAKWATKWFRDFAEFDEFDREKTYLFEIIYKENKIVVDYDFEGLVLIAIRDTETGQDVDITKHNDLLHIRHAEVFDIEDVSKLTEVEKDNAEGFVALYHDTGVRIKFKLDEYKRLHRIYSNVTPKAVWDSLRNKIDISEMLELTPDEFFNEVTEYKNRLLKKYEDIEKKAEYFYDNILVFTSRKEQAKFLKENCKDLMSIIFRMIDNRDYSDLIWKQLKPKNGAVFGNNL